MPANTNVSSQEWMERCRDIAEFYDIDWYAGEFQDVFAAHPDPRRLHAELQQTHTDNISRSLTVAVGQASMVQRLQELQDELTTASFDAHTTIVRHVTTHFGPVESYTGPALDFGDPQVSIRLHFARNYDDRTRTLVFTSGMSALPMTVPSGQEAFQLAELFTWLPAAWPVEGEQHFEPDFYWPFEWLQQIACYPHTNNTWLGGPHTLVSNGEAPEPLAPNTDMTCLMLIAEREGWGKLALPGDKSVVFYGMYPLYTQERDLELAQGTNQLFQLFAQHQIPMMVDPQRVNVAI